MVTVGFQPVGLSLSVILYELWTLREEIQKMTPIVEVYTDRINHS